VVVEQHGGWIEVDSKPGQTMFTVRLPLTGEQRHA
jgi:nitrogen-specific signal transduction histidine kinase